MAPPQSGYETGRSGIVPDSLRLLIERYVEQLPLADQAILEAASVTGYRFFFVAARGGRGRAARRADSGVVHGTYPSMGASWGRRAQKPGPMTRY